MTISKAFLMLNENDDVSFVNPFKINSCVILASWGSSKTSTPRPQVLIDTIINKTSEPKSKAGTEKNIKKPE
jgi:hypothetical protein